MPPEANDRDRSMLHVGEGRGHGRIGWQYRSEIEKWRGPFRLLFLLMLRRRGVLQNDTADITRQAGWHRDRSREAD